MPSNQIALIAGLSSSLNICCCCFLFFLVRMNSSLHSPNGEAVCNFINASVWLLVACCLLQRAAVVRENKQMIFAYQM